MKSFYEIYNYIYVKIKLNPYKLYKLFLQLIDLLIYHLINISSLLPVFVR